jgi:hypothetical protein
MVYFYNYYYCCHYHRHHHLDALFLVLVSLASEFYPSYGKLLVFKFLLIISETVLRSMSALQIKVIPLLDALPLLMLSVGTLTSFQTKLLL